MRESKDKIKSRMLRNAAQIWGFREPQPESSFDPLVSLLLGACAFELEKISSEINNSESRIIERMVNILTPQPITSPRPAYAIAYAKPGRKGARVLPDNQFYIETRIVDSFDNKSSEKQIFFSPTGAFRLTDGRVRYLAAGRRVYEIVDDQYKDIICDKLRTPVPPSSLFIGVELNETATDLTFFFDVISDHLSQTFFHDVETCRWKAGNIVLSTRKGISDISQQEHDIYQLIKRERDLSTKISHHVNRYFSRQFVTVHLRDACESGGTGHGISTNLPEWTVNEKNLTGISPEIIWFEMQFAKLVSDDLLENLTCTLNCFPVINRRHNEYTGSTREMVNIIPLHTEDTFFDLKRVTSSTGEDYRISSFKSQDELTRGTALLRTDGIGRFDSRSAMEYLNYLLELMKEESAAFNVIGSDMISSNLRELNQTIARLEKKIEDVQVAKGDTAYLMLKPNEEDRQVFIEFWSTNCTMANNLRPGQALNVYRADDVEYNASRLMTTTNGGRNKPSTEERINTYRRSLQSGDRIITGEDLKALCLENFGEIIIDALISKGIKKGTSRSEGFVRTIDICLQMKKGCEPDEAGKEAIRQELQVLLEERSSNILPFRIFFSQ